MKPRGWRERRIFIRSLGRAVAPRHRQAALRRKYRRRYIYNRPWQKDINYDDNIVIRDFVQRVRGNKIQFFREITDKSQNRTIRIRPKKDLGNMDDSALSKLVATDLSLTSEGKPGIIEWEPVDTIIAPASDRERILTGANASNLPMTKKEELLSSGVDFLGRPTEEQTKEPMKVKSWSLFEEKKLPDVVVTQKEDQQEQPQKKKYPPWMGE